MNNYKVKIWYFYGNQEEDFEDYEIQAKSEQECIEIANTKHRWIKSIHIIKL